MFLSRIFYSVKSLEILNFDMDNAGKDEKNYFKLWFPEVITLKISESSDLKHF
jgi:hypothetical protein